MNSIASGAIGKNLQEGIGSLTKKAEQALAQAQVQTKSTTGDLVLFQRAQGQEWAKL